LTNFECILKAQAPEELQNKFIEMGFKKMWINKEFQKFNKTFEGRMDQEDMSVSTKDFVDSIGADQVESKVFQFLFDANCDGKVSFDEVLQAYGFMETDGELQIDPRIIIF
jgi:Ca2+-binding EF-hand superfamily protein